MGSRIYLRPRQGNRAGGGISAGELLAAQDRGKSDVVRADAEARRNVISASGDGTIATGADSGPLELIGWQTKPRGERR